MNRDHDAYETLASVYALGALDGDDLAEFEAHLARGCERCAATLSASEETIARLAAEGPRRTPPPEVRRALLQRLEATAPRRERAAGRSLWLPWMLGMAAAVIAAIWVTGGFIAARYEARLDRMTREAAEARERLRQEQDGLRAELQRYAGVIELLRDPATRVVTLRGAGAAPEAGARLVWNETRGGQLFVTNLPPAPEGKAYELWTITGGRPRAAGVFQTDASGKGTHAVEAAPGGKPVEVFAVTVEPAAGASSPTGPIVLASAK
ncbi:MAG: anti-sigma factor [Candidatus Rokubacteria bacterium]|nr:anti-sigma factor [Candidatus Rokubacteria bacterium]